MRIRKITKLMYVTLLVIVLGVVSTNVRVRAASVKVGKPSISAKTGDNSITISISKTSNAEGYRIYYKAPGNSKYQKAKTLIQDGSKERSYTMKVSKSGEYVFKVRAYNNSNNKTIWGKYSKACKINISITEKSNTDKNGVNKDLKEFLDAYEAFLDDYAKFMKKYLQSTYSGDIWSMLEEYDNMLAKLEKYEKKFDELNPQMMTTADYKYYLESLARIEKKLLSLYY